VVVGGGVGGGGFVWGGGGGGSQASPEPLQDRTSAELETESAVTDVMVDAKPARVCTQPAGGRRRP